MHGLQLYARTWMKLKDTFVKAFLTLRIYSHRSSFTQICGSNIYYLQGPGTSKLRDKQKSGP